MFCQPPPPSLCRARPPLPLLPLAPSPIRSPTARPSLHGHKSSLSSERFIGSFLPSAAAGDQPAFELDENDLFATGSGSPELPRPAPRPLILSSVRAVNPSPLQRLRRPPDGILDALPEHRRSPSLSSSSTSSSSASPAAVPPRMIPAPPRPALAPAPHMPQSAPVNVPAAQLRKPLTVAVMGKAEDQDDEEMLPRPGTSVASALARDRGGPGCVRLPGHSARGTTRTLRHTGPSTSERATAGAWEIGPT